MLNTRLSLALYSLIILAGSGVGSRGENVRPELPALETASETVRKVFEVKRVRPLERSYFESLRKCFSGRQQHNVDQFLRVLDELMAARNRVSENLGIKEDWWWPADIGTEVHIVMKNDPLTDRASIPDEISVSAPTLLDRKVEISVEDRYKEIARDGTDLGGLKSQRLRSFPAMAAGLLTRLFLQSGSTERQT